MHISAPGAHLQTPPWVLNNPRPSGAFAPRGGLGRGQGRADRPRVAGEDASGSPTTPTARFNFPSLVVLQVPPVHRRAGATPTARPSGRPLSRPPPLLPPAPAPTGNLPSRSERMCYSLGAAAAAATAPAPEPEPPLPRLPGRPRARSALSPPPPRALPALDAVSAAARLPPAPLRSPSQAEPSPAGPGRGGQGARGRRSVWSQQARRRKRRRKEGKAPPPPPRSRDLGARAPLAPAVPPAPGPPPAQVGRGSWGRGLREAAGARGLFCGSLRGWLVPAPGGGGEDSPLAAVGAGTGVPRGSRSLSHSAPRPTPSVRAGAEYPTPGLGYAVWGPRFPVPPIPSVRRREYPKLAVAESRSDKVPSRTTRLEGPGPRTPRARRRNGDPETFLSVVSAEGGLDRERREGWSCLRAHDGSRGAPSWPGDCLPNLGPNLVVEGGQAVDSGWLVSSQWAWGERRCAPHGEALGGGVAGHPPSPMSGLQALPADAELARRTQLAAINRRL